MATSSAFLEVADCQLLTIDQCSCHHNYFGGGFLSMHSAADLDFRIEVRSLVIQSSYSKSSLLKVSLSSSHFSVVIADSHFQDLSLSTGAIVEARYAVANSDIEEMDSTPSNHFSLRNSTFARVSSFDYLVLVRSIVNCSLEGLQVDDCGEVIRLGKYSSIGSYIDYPLIYAGEIPDSSLDTRCKGFFVLQRTTGTEVKDLSVANCRCSLGGTGLMFLDTKALNTVCDYTSRKNTAAREVGLALHVSGGGQTRVWRIRAIENTHSASGVIAAVAESSLSIFNSMFTGNSGYAGACIHGDSALSLSVTDSEFTANRAATSGGGVISFTPSKLDSALLKITGCRFTANAAHYAGAIALEFSGVGRPLFFELLDTVFTGNAASVEGSSLFTTTALWFAPGSQIARCSFVQENTDIGVIALTHVGGELTISDCDFADNSGRTCSGVSIGTNPLATTRFSRVSFLHSRNSPPLQKLNSYQRSVIRTSNCRFESSQLAAVSLANADWEDSGTVFMQSADSAVQLFSVSARVTGAEFRGNRSLRSAGAVDLSSNSNFTCADCVYSNNAAAVFGGAIVARKNSTLVLYKNVFLRNSAFSGGAIHLSSSASRSVLNDSVFLENLAADAVVYVHASSLLLASTRFWRNAEGTTCLSLFNSELAATNISVEEQSGREAAALSLRVGSSALLEASSITDCRGSSASMALVSGSVLSLKNVNAKRCSGGSLIAAFDGSIVKAAQLSVSDSRSSTGASLFQLQYSELVLQHSRFARFSENGIVGVWLPVLSVLNSTFEEGGGDLGSAVHCSFCSSVVVSNSTFTRQVAHTGAVHINTANTVEIENCTFTGNTAEVAGGLYVFQSSAHIANSAFQLNEAMYGAALQLDCAGRCEYNVSNCVFASNSAAVSGGALRWGSSQPALSNLTFTANSARYGPDLASFASRLSAFLTLLNQSQDSVTPGQPADAFISASLIDHYGQLVVTDNDSEAQLFPFNSTSTFLSGETVVRAVNGTFTFQNFSVFAQPGSTQQLIVRSSIIQATVSVRLRKCIPGETTTAMACFLCAAKTYSFDPALPCQICPAHATCLGNTTVLPLPGYWRFNATSSRFWQCPRAASCLGGTKDSNISLTGFCADGYDSHLCQSCSANYFCRGSDKQCLRCPDHSKSYALSSCVLFGLFLFAAFLMRTSLRSATRLKAMHSVYLKVLVNYLQLTYIVTDLQLNWPEEAVQIFEMLRSVGGAADVVMSIDCFMSESGAEAFYLKKQFIAVLPAALLCISLLFWLAIASCTRSATYLKREFLVMSTVLLFLLHPTLVRSILALFGCTEIEPGTQWLTADLEIPCGDGSHHLNIYAVGVPSVVVWVAGLPLLCLLVLWKKRRDVQWRRHYFGFITSGYQSKCLYWEFLILLRKVAVSSCAVLIPTSHPQAFTAFLLLSVHQSLHYKSKPYMSAALNRLESISNAAAIVTVYTGMYLLTDKMNNSAKILAVVVIAITNLGFLASWIFAMVVYIVETRVRSLSVTSSDEITNLTGFMCSTHSDQFVFVTIEDVYHYILARELAFVEVPELDKMKGRDSRIVPFEPNMYEESQPMRRVHIRLNLPDGEDRHEYT